MDTYSFTHGQMGCFHALAMVNNAALNMGAQIFLQDPAFYTFGCIARGGSNGSYGISIFNFLRKQHIVFISYYIYCLL